MPTCSGVHTDVMPTVQRYGMGTISGEACEEVEFEAFASSMPSICPSSLMALVSQLKRSLELQGVDIMQPCCYSVSHSNCWMASSLSPLNRVLDGVLVELVELQPGRLTLRSTDVEEVYDKVEVDMLGGTLLALWLLRVHHCVECIDFSESALIFNFLDFLAEAIAAAPGLAEIKLNPSRLLQEVPCPVPLLAALRKKTRIKHLDISQISLGDSESKEILVSLQGSCVSSLALSLVAFSRPVKRVLQAVNGCAFLTSLSIKGFNDFNSKQAQFLASALKKNKTLTSLSMCGATTDVAEKILEALGHSTLLEDLSLSCHPTCYGTISGDSLRAVACQLRSLKVAAKSLDSTGASVLADALEVPSCRLESLDLSSSSVNDWGAGRLALSLVLNRTLKHLNLEACLVTADVVKPFVECLQLNSTLESVRLGSLDLPETLKLSGRTERFLGRLIVTWNTSGLHKLACSLNSKTFALTRLDLGWTCQAESTSVLDTFEAVATTSSITELCVFSGKAQDCCTGVVSVLSTSSLRRLVVDLVLDSVLIEKVLRALLTNSTVTEAVFSSSTLSSQRGFCALEDLLRVNRQLCSLTFRRHHMRGKAVMSLARSMCVNHVLVDLNFVETGSYDKNYVHVRDVLNRNRCLRNRAIQFVLKQAWDEESMKAFRSLCDSRAFVEKYAEVAGVSLAAANDAIQAASERCGQVEEK